MEALGSNWKPLLFTGGQLCLTLTEGPVHSLPETGGIGLLPSSLAGSIGSLLHLANLPQAPLLLPTGGAPEAPLLQPMLSPAPFYVLKRNLLPFWSPEHLIPEGVVLPSSPAWIQLPMAPPLPACPLAVGLLPCPSKASPPPPCATPLKKTWGTRP